EGAATPEAKAGHRNPGDLDTNNAGASLYSRPPQRDPIFRDAKVLLFWCDQQQKEYWLDTPLCRHSKRVVPTDRPSLEPIGSYINPGYGATGTAISNFYLVGFSQSLLLLLVILVGVWVTVKATT